MFSETNSSQQQIPSPAFATMASIPVENVASATATATACNFTIFQLNQLLQQSEFGKNEEIFNSYFQKDIQPPRCNACSKLIGEHNNNANQSQVAANGGEVVLIDERGYPLPPSLIAPKLYEENKNGQKIDVFEDTYLNGFAWVVFFMLIFGAILFAVFAASGLYEQKGVVVFVGPAIIAFNGLIFSCFSSKIVIQFNKTTKMISYSKRKYFWRCWNEEEVEMNFDAVETVEKEMTPYHHQNEKQMVLKLKGKTVGNGEEVELPIQLSGIYSVDAQLNGWKAYLRGIGAFI